jgi:hypothetical protein
VPPACGRLAKPSALRSPPQVAGTPMAFGTASCASRLAAYNVQQFGLSRRYLLKR